MDDAVPVVVIDNGSGYVKVGISGDDAPRANISTIVGKYFQYIYQYIDPNNLDRWQEWIKRILTQVMKLILNWGNF